MIRRATAIVLAGAIALGGCSDRGPDDVSHAPGAEQAAPDRPGAPLDRYAGYQSVHYDEPSRWLCRPDVDDVCDGDLTATVVEADGTTSIEAFVPAADPAIDCFYVYPTISRDQAHYSDWEASPEEEGYVVVQQAARLREVCRLFAPVYRQRTLAGLAAVVAGDSPDDEGGPFADVLDAFRTYMAEDNNGRGFVLVGHSQGASLLNHLIRTEIEPDEDVRELLVSAYLAGSAVAVPEGEVVGGDFEHVSLCTAPDQTGCVLTWATFRATSPPPESSWFGRPREGAGAAGCVNPAAVEGGPTELRAYLPATASASILGTLGVGGATEPWLPGTELETRFVTLPGLVTGECVTERGFHYLSVTVKPDPDGPRADDIGGDLTPDWGLHLVDVSIVMGDIVDRVRAQGEAFTR